MSRHAYRGAATLTAVLCGGALVSTVFAAPQGAGQRAPAANPQVSMVIEKRGTVVVELFPRDAPKTVAHILDLVRHKFYDGIRFHRVRPNFMAQVGDPNSRKFTAAQMAGKSDEELGQMQLGVGGSGTSVPLEVGARTHETGTLGMARSPDPNSGDSQFFINFVPNHRLDGGYTVFGKVVKGMDVVQKIQQGDKIVSMREVKKTTPRPSR